MSTLNPVGQCLVDVQSSFREAKRRGDLEYGSRQYSALTEEMLQRVLQIDAAQRAELSKELSREERGLLLGIARSAAIWSVRENAPGQLAFGVIALAIENLRDYRESLMHLSLLDNSARKLGADLEVIYKSIRPNVSREVAELFDTYFREGDRSIAAMGYEEVFEDGKFNYRRNW